MTDNRQEFMRQLDVAICCLSGLQDRYRPGKPALSGGAALSYESALLRDALSALVSAIEFKTLLNAEIREERKKL